MDSDGDPRGVTTRVMRIVGGVGIRGPSGVERRDAAILAAYQAGETLASIGSTFGLSRERVRQIVKASGAPMPSELRCAMPNCERMPRAPNTYCYLHRMRPKSDAGSASKPPLLKDEHGTYASYRDRRCRCDLCRKASADRRRAQFHRVHPEWNYRSRPSPET
jgi:hypothetical protein